MADENNVDKIVDTAVDEISKSDSLDALNECRNKYLSKKGLISNLMLKMKELTIEQKKEYGKIVNDAKVKIETLINTRIEEEKNKLLASELEKDTLDITLPGN